MNKFNLLCGIPFVIGGLFLAGCGSSSSDGGDVVFRGSITQGPELRHEVGEHIPSVQVCALGRCDETDSNGMWSFRFGDSRDQDVHFTLKGHGANTAFVLSIPHQATDIDIEKILYVGHDHDDHDDHDHHDHDHDHHHHSLIEGAVDLRHDHHDHHGHHFHLPFNEQLAVVRVLIDGMEYEEAHDFYGSMMEEDHHHDDHGDHDDHGHDHDDHDHDDHDHDDHDHDDHDHHHH